jgi:hypothetical protein
LQWWIESTLPRQGKNLAAPDLPPPSQQYFLQWNKKIPKNLRALRKLIGKTLRYYGIPYIVVEILEEGPALVLEPQQGGESIQPDSYGRPPAYGPGTCRGKAFRRFLGERTATRGIGASMKLLRSHKILFYPSIK